MGCWTRATPAMMRSPTALIGRPRSKPNSGPAVTRAGIDAVGVTIRCLWRKSGEPRQEPDTRSHRASVRSAAKRAGRSDRANDWHRAGARQDRLAEPGLQHSPPGDAGTARRGMKVECSAPIEAAGGKKEAVKLASQIENRTRPERAQSGVQNQTAVCCLLSRPQTPITSICRLSCLASCSPPSRAVECGGSPDLPTPSLALQGLPWRGKNLAWAGARRAARRL